MKLAINRTTHKAHLCSDALAQEIAQTYRVHNVTVEGTSQFGTIYIDPWGGRWRMTPAGETENVSDAMEKWA